MNTPEQATAIQAAEAAKVLDVIRAYPVVDAASVQFANQLLDETKLRLKGLEAELKTFTKPHRDAEAKVRGWFRPAIDGYKALEELLKGKLRDYELAQIRARTAALLAASEAFKTGSPTAGQAALAAVPEQTEVKGTSFKPVVRFEVEDATKVPTELCSPDPRKIQAAIDLGRREIAGVRIWDDLQVSHRTTKRT